MTRFAAIFAATAAVVALLRPDAAAQFPPGKGTQARIEKKTYQFTDAGNKEMEYALFVPSTYDKAKKTPVVVALHGLKTKPKQIMSYPKLTDLAEKHGFIVVAPMGYNDHGWYGVNMPFTRESNDPPNLNELSEKDVLNVIELVQKDYTTDPDRLYLMGHSMGGAGTLYLGSKYPDRWAALAPIAPALFRPLTDLEKMKNLPVMLVQGDKDRLCPVSTARRWADEMKKLGMTCDYVEVPGGDHVNVAFDKLPQVFEFLAKHKRDEKKAK